MSPADPVQSLTELERRLAIRGPLVMALFVVVFASRILYFSGIMPVAGKPVMIDFDLYHVVARAFWDGVLPQVYHFQSLIDLMHHYRDMESLMPWAYPPPFSLLISPLGKVSLGMAYALFIGISLLAFLLLLRRIAGPLAIYPLLVTFPGVLIEIACGQNGLLTASLLGFAAYLASRDRAAGGVTLGMMVIKPHLGITLGVVALVQRRFALLAVGVATALAACLAATLAMGPSIWFDYQNAARESTILLHGGIFPLFRMVSAYASVRSLRLGAELSYAVQALVSLGVLAALVQASLKMKPVHALGLALISAPMISPYAYDYDVPITTMGLALVAGDWLMLSTISERRLAYLCGIIASGSGMVLFFPSTFYDPSSEFVVAGPPTLAGFFYLGLFVLVRKALRRVPVS